MWTKLKLYFNTIKYLKPIQIRYRLFYVLRRKLGLYALFSKQNFQLTPSQLVFKESIASFPWEVKDNTFEFLNQKVSFEASQINWNYGDLGKLWTYNLNYFEFLHQSDLSKEEGLRYIKDYIEQEHLLLDGLEPYPISLRIIFWIRYIIKHDIKDDAIDKILGKHLIRLYNHIEYHLLGNHLMENSFAFIFGGLYFSNDTIFEKGKSLLIQELQEQILEDGGHFEYSPMYHDILLYRLLDVYNVISLNTNEEYFKSYLFEYIQKMLSWSKHMTFSNSRRSYFNDSTQEIATSFEDLKVYSERLGISTDLELELSESGFRKIQGNHFECIIDIGKVGASYIPGHSHNDALSFELFIMGKPFLINTGISTYNNDEQRSLERSTLAHNTVQIGNQQQSETWAAFRLARRANVNLISSDQSKVEGEVMHYTGAKHRRKYTTSSSQLIIEDEIYGKTGQAAFIFDAGVSEEEIRSLVSFKGASSVQLEDYVIAAGYNNLVPTKRYLVSFKHKLQTTIEL